MNGGNKMDKGPSTHDKKKDHISYKRQEFPPGVNGHSNQIIDLPESR
jgi:hypothetical protein